MKKIVILYFLFLLNYGFAGDVAVFKSLGFSNDGNFYMFGQYGIDSIDLKPYSDIYIIDVSKNTFVHNGVFSEKYNVTPSLGDNGESALFSLIDKTYDFRRKIGINFLQKGTPIFFRIFKETDAELKKVDVIDYKTLNRYIANITQNVTGKTSSFSINMSVYDRNNNLMISKTVGYPSFIRNNVIDYNLVQVIISPNSQSIVFVIQKTELAADGTYNIRYMIETTKI